MAIVVVMDHHRGLDLTTTDKPNVDCGADHELLTATIRIKLKRTQQAKKGWKLDIDNIPEEYKN
jgi:hypothetical protein